MVAQRAVIIAAPPQPAAQQPGHHLAHATRPAERQDAAHAGQSIGRSTISSNQSAIVADVPHGIPGPRAVLCAPGRRSARPHGQLDTELTAERVETDQRIDPLLEGFDPAARSQPALRPAARPTLGSTARRAITRRECRLAPIPGNSRHAATHSANAREVSQTSN